MKLLLGSALLVAMGGLAYGSTVFGLKSTAVSGSASIPPTRLYSFDTLTGAVTDIAPVTYLGGPSDADGLAWDGSRLLAFLLDANGSHLVNLDPNTGNASSLAYFSGRYVRGATVRNGTLYALDVLPSAHWKLLSIDLSNFAYLSVYLDTAIADACDLDFDLAGTLWVAESNAFFTLDPVSGALTLVGVDSAPEAGGHNVFNAGFAFDELSPGRSVVYEVSASDDLYLYNLPVPTRTSLTPNILPNFNSGRGDLTVVPEPGTWGVLAIGMAWLLRRHKGQL